MSTEWLPKLVLFEDAGGNWTAYVERLHEFFEADFVHSTPTWPGKRVGLKRYPEYDGKSATFWHFISEGEDEAERTPDFRRCERIRWPRPLMDAFDGEPPEDTGQRLLWWKSTRKGDPRYVLAPDDFSYKLVVSDRGEYVLPWTAYYIERQHQRGKLRRECEAFWQAQKS